MDRHERTVTFAGKQLFANEILLIVISEYYREFSAHCHENMDNFQKKFVLDSD